MDTHPHSGDPGPGTTRVAVIDIGTVTTRLLVADTDGDTVDEVVRRTVVTHLGEGLHASGRLSEAGIDRVARTVGGFVEEAERLGACSVTAVATSAARDASNGGDFSDRVERAGVRPRIIPGATEARLSFSGATYRIDDDDILVADLGGGSTELVFGSAHDTEDGRDVEIDAARSLDVGSRRVLDMFLHSDPPTAGELRDASTWVADQMRPFFDGMRSRPRTLITLAGDRDHAVGGQAGTRRLRPRAGAPVAPDRRRTCPTCWRGSRRWTSESGAGSSGWTRRARTSSSRAR